MLSWLLFKNYLLSSRSGALVRIIAWHCILGIGMGVAALVIVLSVMNGFNLTIRGRMLSVEPHLVVNEKPTDDIEAKLKDVLHRVSQKGLQSINRFESQDVIVRSVEGSFAGAAAKGYEPQVLANVLDRIWRSVKRDTPPPMPASAELAADEVMLGAELARSLSVFEGDEVILIPPEALLLPEGEVPKFQKFRIKSTVDTEMPEFDSKLVFYNLKASGRQLQSLSLDTGFEIRLNDPYEAENIKIGLTKAGFKTETWGERDTSLFFALKMESIAMTLFLSLAVLITSFSIVIVMVLLMNQKRQDIGMMLALGMTVKRVRRIFLKVGLMLSFLGIAGGVFIGTAVCLFLDFYPLELLPDIYTDSTLPAKLTWRIFLFVLGSSSLIALIGSWLPVARLGSKYLLQLNRRA